MLRFVKASVSLTRLILIFVAIGCASRQISEEQIETCLTRTDWPEHNVAERAAIAWLVDYETKIKNTSCCALEPRPSVLAKRGELKPLNAEILTRIDALEAGSDAAKRAQLSGNDKCYRALMNLYHDVMFAARSQR